MVRLPEGVPVELWEYIYLFTGQPALSRTCQHLWGLDLHKQRQKVRLGEDEWAAWAAGCCNRVQTASVSVAPSDLSRKKQKTGTLGPQLSALSLSQLWPVGLSTALALLKGSTTLQTLDLHLRGWRKQRNRRHIGEALAEALAMLKGSTTLQTLELHLRGNQIGDAGAQTLALLKESKTIQTLHLCLCFNRIGVAGAEALATLKESETLQTLYLNLADDQIGDAGAQALATLKESKILRTLHLGLCFNGIKDAGAEALATLKESETLQTLYLNLAHNHITEAGAQALATLMESSTLQTLNLDLSRNVIRDAHALEVQKSRSNIRDLHLPLDCLCQGPRMSAPIPINCPKRGHYTNIATGEILYDTDLSDTESSESESGSESGWRMEDESSDRE